MDATSAIASGQWSFTDSGSGIASYDYIMAQDPGLSLGLGTVPVNLTNFTQAYSAFAQQGTPALVRKEAAPPAVAAWPTKPVKLVIGFPPGSVQDLWARALFAGCQERHGDRLRIHPDPRIGYAPS